MPKRLKFVVEQWVIYCTTANVAGTVIRNFRIGLSLSNRIGTYDSNRISKLRRSLVPSYSNNWNPCVQFPICEIAYHSSYVPVFYHFRDKARYWSKIAIFFISPVFDDPVSGSPSEYCDNVECGTIRMVWRPDDDKTVIRLAVLTQYRRVTDGQTDIVCDGRTDGHRVWRTDIVWRTDRRTSCVTDGQTSCDGRTDGHRATA